MAASRREKENFIITYVEKIVPGIGNKEIYERFFKTLSDEEFNQFMLDLASEKKFLVLYCPSFKEKSVSLENNLAIADELGHNFFQKIWIEGSGDIPTYLTPVEYLVVDLPVRRASQLLTKKISVPDHNKSIDTLTGQPVNQSKGASISYPELQVLSGLGLQKSSIELMKFRGGDIKGGSALNKMLSTLGTANLDTLSHYDSGVESSKTLKTIFTGMHIKNNVI